LLQQLQRICHGRAHSGASVVHWVMSRAIGVSPSPVQPQTTITMTTTHGRRMTTASHARDAATTPLIESGSVSACVHSHEYEFPVYFTRTSSFCACRVFIHARTQQTKAGT